MKLSTLASSIIFAVAGYSLQVLASDDITQGNSILLQSTKAAMLQPNQVFLPKSTLVTWTVIAPEVAIYQAKAPDKQLMKLVADKVTGNSYLLEHNAAERLYVYIQPKGHAGYWVAERVLPLHGGVNFRDLGGYRTEDGRSVVWGKLFRSGTMSDLTSADYEYLSKLGIKTFCDFRSSEERTEEPTQYQQFAPAAQMLSKDYSLRDMMNDSFTEALAQLSTREQAIQAFGSFYRKGVTTYAGQFRDMFAQLLQNKAPLAFNCSAGKDRTGMAAALLLSALGVPRDVVVADYALSEQAYDFGLREMKKRMTTHQEIGGESPHNQMFAKLPREVINVFMGTDPALIEAFFQQIEQDYGSVANYLSKEIQLSDADIAQLRNLYLTVKA